MKSDGKHDLNPDEDDSFPVSGENGPGDPLLSDKQLDELLSLARWPDVPLEAVVRLQAVCQSADGTADVSDTGLSEKVLQHSIPQLSDAPRSRRSSGLLAASLAGKYGRGFLVLALVVMAFVSGHWFAQWRLSTPQPQDVTGVTETKVTPPNQMIPEERPDVEGRDVVVPAMPVRQPDSMGQPDSSTVAETTEPKVIGPVPEPIPEPEFGGDGQRTKREQLQQKYRAQLQSVLACLAEQNEERSSDDQWKCIQPLMARRAEFEYLLWEVIETSTGQQKMAALTAVGFVGTQRSVPRLMGATADKSLRAAAIESLKRCADEATLTGFILQQQDADLSREFARVLASRRNDAALQAWLYLVREPAARSSCLQAADELSPDLVERLFVLLDAPLLTDRLVAVVSLGSRTDQATKTRLVRLMNQYVYRWEPVAALMWNGSPDAMHVLQQRQSDVEHFAVMQTASIQLASFVGSGSKQRPD